MTYRDPDSGLAVLTEVFLRRQGYCCGRGCRHCPYRKERARTAPRPPQRAPQRAAS